MKIDLPDREAIARAAASASSRWVRPVMKERAAWWLVCIVPRFLARWLMFGGGRRIWLPGDWIPYLFGRALGVEGKRQP